MLRFNINDANLLAHLITDSASNIGEKIPDKEFLVSSLLELKRGFLSAPDIEIEFRKKIDSAVGLLDNLSTASIRANINAILKDIKDYLTTRLWTALIIPSGQGEALDGFLLSWNFAKEMVDLRPNAPGLILLTDGPGLQFSLLDVFPAFETALSHATKWPGILIWERGGESAFFPLDSRTHIKAKETARWIFSHLATASHIDLKLLLTQFYREYPQLTSSNRSNISFIHLSDIHLGSKEANSRIPRLQQLIRNVIKEIPEESRIVFLLSGDIMDSPNKTNIDKLRSFMDYFFSLGKYEPVVVLGNHDVRQDGFLDEDFKFALRMPGGSYRVEWFDDCRVGIVCFNSVIEGRLARGFIGSTQLSDLGTAIDRKDEWKDYDLFALLHHHPIPIETPSWYAKPFYERLLGNWFERTECLEDAEKFIRFVEKRNMRAVFHGHKHIPWINRTEGQHIPVFGCGSSVGKVVTVEKDTFISINVYNYDAEKKFLSGRLLAERMEGEGLTEVNRHEVIYRSYTS